jgi:hypothetical protein
MSATLRGGVNLAYWLAKVHPELFNALIAPAAQRQRKMGALGDDGSGLDFTIDYPSGYSAGDTSYLSSQIPTIDPSLLALPDPQLSSVGIDAALTTPSVPIDTSGATAPTSSAGGLGGALASIGSFLSSAAGLTSLSNLATAVYKANTPQAATVATQIARVQGGTTPAPITYAYNSAGQLVPVLAKANTAGVSLTPQSLAGLVPSSLTPYVVPTVIGLLLLWAFSSNK